MRDVRLVLVLRELLRQDVVGGEGTGAKRMRPKRVRARTLVRPQSAERTSVRTSEDGHSPRDREMRDQ